MPRKRPELTRELVDAYCRALDKTTPQIAASVVGVTHRQMKAWLDAGASLENDDELLAYLVSEEAKVQSDPHKTRGRLLKSLMDAADCDPRIALELAKMMIPSLTAPKQLDVTVTPNVGPRVDYSKFSDEQLAILEQAEAIKALASGDE